VASKAYRSTQDPTRLPKHSKEKRRWNREKEDGIENELHDKG
jgi:hypothetical protein